MAVAKAKAATVQAKQVTHRAKGGIMNWAAEVLAAQGAALSAAGSLRLPLLVMYAGADTIADPAASRELFAAASSADETLRCYEGYYHELFNEVGRARVFADLAAWLAARV